MKPLALFSKISLAFLVIAMVCYARADLAFRNGVAGDQPTNIQYYEALISAFPSEPREPGWWPGPAVTEVSLMIALVAASVFMPVLSIGFALWAWRRGESRANFAGVFVLSVSVLIIALRLALLIGEAYKRYLIEI